MGIKMNYLSYGHVEAALLDFIFNEATILLAEITKHFGEHPFERVVANLTTTRPVRILDCTVTIVADIKCGAVEMAGILRGIAVAPAQLNDILLRAQHAGDNHLMQRHTLDIERVVERLADILEQNGCSRHQIRNAGIQRIDVIIRIGANIDQFTLAHLGILAVLDGRYAPLLGSSQLYTVGVGKGFGIAGDTEDAVRG